MPKNSRPQPLSTLIARTGLTNREIRFLRSLRPACQIQRYLDSLTYDSTGRSCRSPRRVIREQRVQCMDGALFAAAALYLQGYPALIVDLEAERDDDHVIAVYRRDGAWGALARSNFSGLRSREPIYRTLRELVLSYFESYFNLRREKTLRRYSAPVDLDRFLKRRWLSTEEDLWDIPGYLVTVRHYS
ncbi:MAG: hypothetical protein MUF51_10140, partial [Vicinamibacteria bacterium]|nr:hypothetical protein [Vicinamibacteria bacterium]